tara:strand:+ start:2172 stop:3539 length:1368 start_codon:yes stop_codon:yes gene_type:complete
VSSQSQYIQYQNTDTIYDYQNLVLHEFLVREWAKNLDNKTNLHQLIESDLKKLQQMAFIAIFNDNNNNQVIDFEVDNILDTMNYINPSIAFNHRLYTSYMDSPTLSQKHLKLPQHNIWISYGEYFVKESYRGTTNLPANFVEYPLSNNQILGVWLITDYDIGPDIYWPAIIVPISIIILLIVLFWIINSFLYPIKLIRRHVVNLKKGNLGSLIPITGSDELGQLARSINKMTKDIDILVSQKQNLLIDVSHELKTPLTRLKFLLANMEINQQNKDSINKEINYLQDMISNMLLSDKLSTPYVEDLEEENIQLKNLIDDACGMFYEIENRLKIITDIPPIIIKVDKYKLSLAIKNLIDNAIKYGGRARLIELSVIQKDVSVEIQVEDFGKGIDQNKLKKIMKPLYRGRLAKEKSRSGFGLGLAITKKIVEAHKGSLTINSELNKGTKFIVALPIKK